MSLPPISVTAPEGPDDAPLLVLGCSLGTGAHLWTHALPALRQHRRVSIWELPGHGGAPPVGDAELSVRSLARAVAAAYDEPFDYAGVSIGGAVGLELAIHHVPQVRSAAIICSGAVIGTAAGWHERAAQVRAQGTSALVVGSAQRWFAPGTIAREPVHTGEMLHGLRDTDDESYARSCEALATFDVRTGLPSISVPVLAAWGEHDAVTPAELSEAIAAAVPNGKALRIAGASHLAPVDAPLATAAAINDFLQSHKG